MMIPNYFIIMLAVVLIGLVGIIRLLDLKTIEADQVLAQMLSQRAESAYWLAILVFLGAAAAIMSTAAGVLLTLSSMVTHDLYRQFVRPHASENEIATIGRVFTVIILVVVTLLSLHPITTLWRLTVIKFEFLMQLYLPMILGLLASIFSNGCACRTSGRDPKLGRHGSNGNRSHQRTRCRAGRVPGESTRLDHSHGRQTTKWRRTAKSTRAILCVIPAAFVRCSSASHRQRTINLQPYHRLMMLWYDPTGISHHPILRMRSRMSNARSLIFSGRRSNGAGKHATRRADWARVRRLAEIP